MEKEIMHAILLSSYILKQTLVYELFINKTKRTLNRYPNDSDNGNKQSDYPLKDASTQYSC